jgi:PhnB protein
MPKKAPKPVPKGMNTVTPVLNFKGDCSTAIAVYKKAFGAVVVGDIATGPNGKVLHAMIKIGGSNIMLSDVMHKDVSLAGLRSNMWVYVDDCDKMFNRAVAAGCTVVWPLTDMFWGDRTGVLKDPFGHQWSIATLKWVLKPEEMRKAQDEWLKSVKK